MEDDIAFKPEWSVDDIKILISRIPMGHVPTATKLSINALVMKLNWEKIKFGDYTADDCRVKFLEVRTLIYKKTPLEMQLDLMRKVCEQNPAIFQKIDKSKNLNAYNFYVHEQIPQIKGNYPDCKSVIQLMPILAKKWKKLSSEEKKVYVEQAGEAKHLKQLESNPLRELPTLPKSAVELYIEENKEELAHLSEKKLRKKLTKRFKKLDETEQKPWRKAAKRQAKSFLIELKNFQAEHPRLAVVIPQVKDLIAGECGPLVLPPPKHGTKSFYQYCTSRLWAQRDQSAGIPFKEMFRWMGEEYKKLSQEELAAYKSEYNQSLEEHKDEVKDGVQYSMRSFVYTLLNRWLHTWKR